MQNQSRVTDRLVVGGIISLTTVDFPGHLSITVFCQGCPWRCRYCHNKHLQPLFAHDGLPWEDVLYLMESRKNFVDSVVFSGGEPLIHDDLRYAIEDVQKLGLTPALHTSGALPAKFAAVVDMVDWIGFDVKAPFNDYQKITGVPNSGVLASESLDILLASGKSYEVRISLDPILTIDDVNDILLELYERGVQVLTLQNIRNAKNAVIPHPFLADVSAMSQASSMFKTLKTRNT